ncbi:MAG: hypothetical protein HYZ94_00790 [Candidatus Omnitrophica bacterium]|nr:hypothetical protein [Candidatus Omnitrophota bacterium]
MNKPRQHATPQAQDLHALRHSAAHIMAQAVRRLWPQVKLAIGPPIEDGFYYDLDLAVALTDDDLPKIEAEMAKIIKDALPFQQSFMTKDEAVRFFRERGEAYKLEIIDGIPDAKVSIYTDGDFTDLCEGPHVSSTGEVKAFKLLSVAGAYWRGDEKNAQLQRIYGTAYFTSADLDAHLKRVEEAKRRDHRKLGRSLGLFGFEELAGPGLVFYHPKGALVRWLIEDYIRQAHLARGYQPVATPHIFRTDIWNPAHLPDRHLEALRPPGLLPRLHVPVRIGGQDPLRDQADELPGAHPHLPRNPPQLPGAAAAVL